VAGDLHGQGDGPSFNPLIIHAAMSIRHANMAAGSDTAIGFWLAPFWPVQWTLVLPLAEGHGVIRPGDSGVDSIAIPHPAHSTAAPLLRALRGRWRPVGQPLGQDSALTTDAACPVGGLQGRLLRRCRFDGPCTVGAGKGTIIGLMKPATPYPPARSGLPSEAIVGGALGRPLFMWRGAEIIAPGQFGGPHYAPHCQVRVERAGRQKKTRSIFGLWRSGRGLAADDLTLFAQRRILVEARPAISDKLHPALDRLRKNHSQWVGPDP